MNIPKKYKYIEIAKECDECVFSWIDGCENPSCFIFGDDGKHYWDGRTKLPECRKYFPNGAVFVLKESK